MDQQSEKLLQALKLDDVSIVPLTTFESDNPELAAIKPKRTIVEYYFTTSPFLPLYIFSKFNEVDILTYLDADLLFFSDPEPLFTELGKNSISIIEHRYSKGLEHNIKHGKYNVGWLSFRNDNNGVKCLTWWKERCLEWCHDYYEDGKFGDQKYLDAWPVLFSAVHVIQHKGANVAPWNVSSSTISNQDKKILIEGDPLIFYHFQGLRKLSSKMFDSGLGLYSTTLTSVLRHKVYRPYVLLLNRIFQDLNITTPSLKTVRVPENGSFFESLFINFKWWIYFITKVLLRRNFIIVR